MSVYSCIYDLSIVQSIEWKIILGEGSKVTGEDEDADTTLVLDDDGLGKEMRI